MPKSSSPWTTYRATKSKRKWVEGKDKKHNKRKDKWKMKTDYNDDDLNNYENHNDVSDYSNVEFDDWSEQFDEGYDAAQNGKQKSDCPYKKGKKRNDWIGGWETVCLDGEFDILNHFDL